MINDNDGEDGGTPQPHTPLQLNNHNIDVNSNAFSSLNGSKHVYASSMPQTFDIGALPASLSNMSEPFHINCRESYNDVIVNSHQSDQNTFISRQESHSRDAMNDYLVANLNPANSRSSPHTSSNSRNNSADTSPEDSSSLGCSANLVFQDGISLPSSTSDEENQLLVWQEDRPDSPALPGLGNHLAVGDILRANQNGLLHQMGAVGGGPVVGVLANQVSEDFIDIDMLPQSYMAHDSDWDGVEEDEDRDDVNRQGNQARLEMPDNPDLFQQQSRDSPADRINNVVGEARLGDHQRRPEIRAGDEDEGIYGADCVSHNNRGNMPFMNEFWNNLDQAMPGEDQLMGAVGGISIGKDDYQSRQLGSPSWNDEAPASYDRALFPSTSMEYQVMDWNLDRVPPSFRRAWADNDDADSESSETYPLASSRDSLRHQRSHHSRGAHLASTSHKQPDPEPSPASPNDLLHVGLDGDDWSTRNNLGGCRSRQGRLTFRCRHDHHSTYHQGNWHIVPSDAPEVLLEFGDEFCYTRVGYASMKAQCRSRQHSNSNHQRSPPPALLGLNGLAASSSTGHLLDLDLPHISSNQQLRLSIAGQPDHVSPSTTHRTLSLSMDRLHDPHFSTANETSEALRVNIGGGGEEMVEEKRDASDRILRPVLISEEQSVSSGAAYMIWNDLEASLSQRARRIPTSTCAVVAIINVLRSLNLSHHCTAEQLTAAINNPHHRHRSHHDYQETSRRSQLVEYLISRSQQGPTGSQVVSAVNRLLPDVVYGRFFPVPVSESGLLPLALSDWLVDWMQRGVVPVLSLNLQRGVPAMYVVPDNAWQHHMVYGVKPEGICMTNPVQIVPENIVLQQLSSESILLVRKADVHSFWTVDDSDLTPLVMHSDPRWAQMNVLGQVVCTLREASQSHFNGFYPVWAHHITIPSVHQPGIALFSPAHNHTLCASLRTAVFPLSSTRLPGHISFKTSPGGLSCTSSSSSTSTSSGGSAVSAVSNTRALLHPPPPTQVSASLSTRSQTDTEDLGPSSIPSLPMEPSGTPSLPLSPATAVSRLPGMDSLSNSSLSAPDTGGMPLNSSLSTPDAGGLPLNSSLSAPDAGGLSLNSSLSTPDAGGLPLNSSLSTPDAGGSPLNSSLSTPDVGGSPLTSHTVNGSSLESRPVLTTSPFDHR